MKVKTISVTYGRKINLGDYNSAEIGLTLWADLEEGEDHVDAVRELQRESRELARDEYRRLVGKTSTANGTVKP